MGPDDPTDDRTDGEQAGGDRTAGSPDPAPDPPAPDPTAPDPLADADAGVAVDDDPGQVDLNVGQWDSE